jgi:hypothetical protein
MLADLLDRAMQVFRDWLADRVLTYLERLRVLEERRRAGIDAAGGYVKYILAKRRSQR